MLSDSNWRGGATPFHTHCLRLSGLFLVKELTGSSEKGREAFYQLQALGLFKWEIATSCSWREATGAALPKLYYRKGSLSDRLLQECTVLQEIYAPPIWARNRHIHLIASAVLRKPLFMARYSRQLLTASDGGIVAIDWFQGCNDRSALPLDAPIVMIIHALAGDSHDAFVKTMASAVFNRGWRAVAFNYRGCGGSPLTTPKIFCQGDTSDFFLAISEIRDAFPKAPVFAAGFSLGAYTLNKYVGQVGSGFYGPEGRLDGAACLGSGFDFNAEMALSEEPYRISYDAFLLKYWKDYVHKHRRVLQKNQNIDWEAVKRARTLPELDKELACKIFGYKTVSDYYEDSNGLIWIPRIHTPCLLLTADDDPFLDPKVKPEKLCLQSDCVIFCSTRHGSHCAHLKGWWPLGYSWLDRAVPQFFDVIMRQQLHGQHGPIATRQSDREPSVSRPLLNGLGNGR